MKLLKKLIRLHKYLFLAAAYLASYACELSAHEMRMGYALFYLKSDVRMLSKLNAGEEQSAMLNGLSELSAYLNEAFFSFIKQSLSFVSTIIFLSCKNFKLTILSVLPVIPLILYCSFSGKIIQCHTGQCLEKKTTLNGLTDTVIELFPIIQIYNAYRLTNDVINDHLLSWQEHNIRKERVSAGLMSLSGLLSFLPLLLLLGAGMMMGGPLNVPHAATAMINTAISSFLLIRSSLLLSIAAWGFILPYLLLHYRLVLKHMPRLKETSLNAISENTSAIKPLITEADAILLYDAGNLLLKQCEKSSLELMKTNMRMHMRSALGDAIVRLFGISGYLVLLVLGYRMIRVGTISFPDLIYCFQIRGSVLAGISMLLICFNNIKTNQVCVKRIHDTLSM